MAAARPMGMGLRDELEGANQSPEGRWSTS
jgi:hypothetical protein